MQLSLITICLLATRSATMNVIIGTNTSLRGAGESLADAYGDNKCRCIGIDNMKGYYAAQVDFHHVQYQAETGATCDTWDQGKNPACKATVPPQWCNQAWCYVDPCSCDIEKLATPTETGIVFQGKPAYWSYHTCGSTDFYGQTAKAAAATQGKDAFPDACVHQKSPDSCAQKSDCAWDGKKCGGKDIVEMCKGDAKKEESKFGEEDCRCVGLGGSGREVGKAFLHINDKDLVAYPATVGGSCEAWEDTTHPDCLKKDGERPAWCSDKWCFVDPCKCKTKVAPKAVMPANQFMRFQGKTAYWSYATCGSVDSWTSEHTDQYCPPQKTEEDCVKLDKCAWTGKECLGKALATICEKQESTGILGMESPLPSGAFSLAPLKALAVMLVAFAMV